MGQSTLHSSPFTICPDWVLDLGLSPTALAVYLQIRRHANEGNPGKFPTPGVARIGALVGRGKTQVREALAELEAAGALKRHQRSGNSSSFEILGPPDNPTGQPVDPQEEGNPTGQPVDPHRPSGGPPTGQPVPNKNALTRTTELETTPPAANLAPTNGQHPVTPMDELLAAWGKPDRDSQYGLYQKIVNLARGHPPGEITRRMRNHAAGYNFALTPGSLLKRWDELGGGVAELNTKPLKERQRLKQEMESAQFFEQKIREEELEKQRRAAHERKMKEEHHARLEEPQ